MSNTKHSPCFLLLPAHCHRPRQHGAQKPNRHRDPAQMSPRSKNDDGALGRLPIVQRGRDALGEFEHHGWFRRREVALWIQHLSSAHDSLLRRRPSSSPPDPSLSPLPSPSPVFPLPLSAATAVAATDPSFTFQSPSPSSASADSAASPIRLSHSFQSLLLLLPFSLLLPHPSHHRPRRSLSGPHPLQPKLHQPRPRPIQSRTHVRTLLTYRAALTFDRLFPELHLLGEGVCERVVVVVFRACLCFPLSLGHGHGLGLGGAGAGVEDASAAEEAEVGTAAAATPLSNPSSSSTLRTNPRIVPCASACWCSSAAVSATTLATIFAFVCSS
ncbi:hypothetical protein CVT25_004912 [Psilocybe cyanescens]|uniref:Uncharacterized protein n=1 Tax=Psilocybe cyanescens TaxID=93625 RepID=A0A409W408_PSICY|nr:hypothetical protein CVT25_004912 [Psilocybe cyanescens]